MGLDDEFYLRQKKWDRSRQPPNNRPAVSGAPPDLQSRRIYKNDGPLIIGGILVSIVLFSVIFVSTRNSTPRSLIATTQVEPQPALPPVQTTQPTQQPSTSSRPYLAPIALPISLDAARAMSLQYVNEQRQRAGVSLLVEDPLLNLAAQQHADDMLRRAYFSARSLDGYGVTERYLTAGGNQASSIGTNMMQLTGENAPPSQPMIQGFEQSWTVDPAQQAIFLRPEAKVFGYGLVSDPAQGKVYAVQAIGVGPSNSSP